MNIDNSTLVYILVAAVIVALIVCYSIAYVMTDHGRIELKKMAVRKQLDLELAKVGAAELMKTEEARHLMLEAMRRARNTESQNFESTVNALLSDRP